jgi:hypothetical protein
LHWFDDSAAVNGERYEYAVSAVNVVDQESALSYEFVTDAPLPLSEVPVELFFAGGAQGHLAGFDFSMLEAGRVDPDVIRRETAQRIDALQDLSRSTFSRWIERFDIAPRRRALPSR